MYDVIEKSFDFPRHPFHSSVKNITYKHEWKVINSFFFPEWKSF